MKSKLLLMLVFTLFILGGVIVRSQAQKSSEVPRTIPKTWDDQELVALEVPLADPNFSPAYVSSEYYYRIPVMPIYKSYPIYAPGKEPPGYWESLEKQKPETIFDASKLKTEEDWIKAGALVFEAPFFYNALNSISDLKDPKWYEKSRMPIAKDGTMPFNVYVVRQPGKIEVGEFSCATCHTRVMPDGTVIKGAQGNYPLGRLDELQAQARLGKNEKQYLANARRAYFLGYHTPWVQPDLLAQFDKLTLEEFAGLGAMLPPGVQSRPGVSLFYPVQVPDLIGVKDRRYLDRTGLQRHRSIGDLMRYAALNQGAQFLSRYGKDFIPIGRLPDPTRLHRYSDEHLYALALYLYSLKPPPNPNKFDALARRGKKIFQESGCGNCHTPPLYTNNKLTPVDGFTIPKEHLKTFDIVPSSVGTDPGLALKTRRATGYYKVPSLKGVWYRGPFEHSGSVMTLEDWFDPNRTRDDYVPTGYRGPGVKTRAVKGHPFGYHLSEQERKALIAFLKTL